MQGFADNLAEEMFRLYMDMKESNKASIKMMFGAWPDITYAVSKTCFVHGFMVSITKS